MKKGLRKLVVCMLAYSVMVFIIACGTAIKTEASETGTVETEVEETKVDEIEAIGPVEEEEEETEPLTYVEENGLTFSQVLSGTVQGYRSNGDRTDYEFVDTDWEITAITIEKADKEGYITITCEIKHKGYDFEGYLKDGFHSYTIKIPKVEICDLYTGVVVPAASSGGNMAYDSYIEIERGENVYSIGETYNTFWVTGDWVEDNNNGNWTRLETLTTTNVITIPEDYDGLTLMIAPITEVITDKQKNYGEVNYSEIYHIMDYAEDNGEIDFLLIRVQDAYNMLNGISEK